MTNERGSVTVLVSAIVLLAMVGTLLVVDVAKVMAVRAGLVVAADAAALAAAPATFAAFGQAVQPQQAAVELAVANGTELVRCDCPIDRSWRVRRVVVTVGTEVELTLLADRYLTASAAAEFRPVAMGLAGRNISSESPP